MNTEILIKSNFLLEIYVDTLQPGGGQSLERRNGERPVFRNFEITNIKMKKDGLIDHFIFELF